MYIINLPTHGDVFFNLNGWNGFSIDGTGATIKRNIHMGTGQHSFLFRFNNCKNISAQGLRFITKDDLKVDLSTDGGTGTDRGYTAYHFSENNSGVVISNTEMSDNYRLVLVGNGIAYPGLQNSEAFIHLSLFG
jgi:hypothetical protein